MTLIASSGAAVVPCASPVALIACTAIALAVSAFFVAIGRRFPAIMLAQFERDKSDPLALRWIWQITSFGLARRPRFKGRLGQIVAFINAIIALGAALILIWIGIVELIVGCTR